MYVEVGYFIFMNEDYFRHRLLFIQQKIIQRQMQHHFMS
jgi:hypothetical protein